MKRKLLSKVVFVLLLVCAIWTESFLPILIIAILFDFNRKKSLIKKVRRFLKEHLGIRFRWVEWFAAVAVSVWFVAFLQSGFFGIYTFHTSSMNGTLKAGDLLFVNKTVPGARRNANNMNWYHRMIGFGKLDYKDIIIFNFPEGDTLLKKRPTESYYYLKRLYGNGIQVEGGKNLSDLEYFDVEKRPRFVKRIYGLPGDTLLIKDDECFVNDSLIHYPDYSIERYSISDENKVRLQRLGIKPYNELTTKDGLIWELYHKDVLISIEKGVSLNKDYLPQNYPDPLVFPFSTIMLWNMNNMGPVYIPKKGTSVKLTHDNVGLYSRIISVFERNELKIEQSGIFINKKQVESYTFKMDYYWVMGDNLPHSFDSRFWGFVPENHILGKVEKVLLSKDLQKKKIFGFRSDRFLLSVD